VEGAELELLFAGFVSTSTFVTTAESVFLLDASFKCGPDVPELDTARDALSEVRWCNAELLVSGDCTSLCSGFIGSVPLCVSPSRVEVTVRFDRTFLCTFFLVLFPDTLSNSAESGNCTGNKQETIKLNAMQTRICITTDTKFTKCQTAKCYMLYAFTVSYHPAKIPIYL